MRIFIPFTLLNAETYAATPDATLVPLIDKKFGYGRYFRERWNEKETFINVEHDVVPSFDALAALWNCPEELCVTAYHKREGIDHQPEVSYLGCVKISKDFIEKHPHIFDHDMPYSQCDTQIWTASNQTHHYHGEVTHLK